MLKLRTNIVQISWSVSKAYNSRIISRNVLRYIEVISRSAVFLFYCPFIKWHGVQEIAMVRNAVRIMTYEFSEDMYSGRATVIFSCAAKLGWISMRKLAFIPPLRCRSSHFVLGSSLSSPRLSEKRTTRCFKFNNVCRPTRRSLAISKNIAKYIFLRWKLG